MGQRHETGCSFFSCLTIIQTVFPQRVLPEHHHVYQPQPAVPLDQNERSDDLRDVREDARGRRQQQALLFNS